MSTMTATYYSLQDELDEGNTPGFGFVVSFPEVPRESLPRLHSALVSAADALRVPFCGGKRIVEDRFDDVYVGLCWADDVDVDGLESAIDDATRTEDRGAERMRWLLREFADRRGLRVSIAGAP